MDKKQSTSRPSWRIELIAAAVLGILAVACFAIQILTATNTTSPKETALFNSLQFLLTVGFTWFSTRAISRYEFEQSVKRFAISAYRRVADIERMVTRLRSEVRNMIAESPERDARNLHIVEAIVSDTCQVVRSSIADWADVIGDELLAIEKIKRLEQEKVEIHEDPPSQLTGGTSDKAIAEINKQIEQLKSTLPARLQYDALTEEAMWWSDLAAARWIARQHKKEDGLRLMAVTGEIYPHERDISTLQSGEILHAKKTEDETVNVVDGKGAMIGRLQNYTPLDYDNFVRALHVCYGDSPIKLGFVELNGSEERDGEVYAWFTVKVLQEPIVEERMKQPFYSLDSE